MAFGWNDFMRILGIGGGALVGGLTGGPAGAAAGAGIGGSLGSMGGEAIDPNNPVTFKSRMPPSPLAQDQMSQVPQVPQQQFIPPPPPQSKRMRFGYSPNVDAAMQQALGRYLKGGY